MEGNIISKPLQNSGGGLEWSNDGEIFSSNDSITCLNFDEFAYSTEYNSYGYIPTPVTGITLNNENSRMINYMSIWCIYGIPRQKLSRLKV